MKTALDTSILSTIWSAQAMQAQVRATLNALQRHGSLVISPAAYAEALAHPSYSEAGVHHFLQATRIRIDPMLDATWTEAGRRYRQYAIRRRQLHSEPPRRILADFLIGAHALLQTDQLITLDTRYYRQYFPDLKLCPVPE